MDLLRDDVRKLFYHYLIPAISSAVAVAAYDLVDTIAIGHGVGPNGMAASAVILPLFSIELFIGLLCGIGGSVLMSGAKGSGDPQRGNQYYSASWLCVSVLTVAAWILLLLFQKEFYRFCGADDVILPYAMNYGSWIVAFLPTFILTTFLGCFVRNDDAPGFVMKSILVGSAVNIFGDWFFVFPLHMGMSGAGLATVLGSSIQFVILAAYLFTPKCTLKFVKSSPWLSAIPSITIIGFGAGFTKLAMIVVSFIANNQIMKYEGSDALAVYGMVSVVSAIFLDFVTGIGQAAQPIVSQNYGARNHARCWTVEKFGMRTSVLFGGIITVTFLLFPSQITMVFMKVTPEVLVIAPHILRVYAWSFLPLAVCVFITLYLQSMMQAKMATVLSLAHGIVLNSILLYALPLLLGGDGIWWAIVVAEGGAALIAVFYMLHLYREYVRFGMKKNCGSII